MRHLLPIIVFMSNVILCGCTGTMHSMSDLLHAGPWWAAEQAGLIQLRAKDLETSGELAMALDHWRLFQQISSDQGEATQEIERLEEKITQSVQSHYQKGLTNLKEKKLDAARNHFLAALRLDPAFKPAMEQIKTRYSPFPIAVYQSASGDRPATVAKKVFGDKKKAFLVAWFNDLPEDKVLKPGTLLILPKLEKTPVKKIRKKVPPHELAEASVRMAKNDINGALALVKQADPDDPAIQALTHTIHVKQAMEQIKSGRLEDARQALATVPDGFAGKKSAQEKLNGALEERQFTLDVAKTREKLDHGYYQESLDLAEELMKNAPDSVEASNLAAEARYRLALDHFDHKRFFEARDVLEKADDGYDASVALEETVKIRLAELAQIHYRNGVKHFINEDLKSAIAEWKIALACDPGHDKAHENIENARRIMQKIEKMP